MYVLVELSLPTHPRTTTPYFDHLLFAMRAARVNPSISHGCRSLGIVTTPEIVRKEPLRNISADSILR